MSVPPDSSQLDPGDKLWRLHSALLQCRSFLDRAILKEDEELGANVKGEYETQRRRVKERLSILIELLAAADDTAAPAPHSEGSEVGADIMSRVVTDMNE